MRGELSVVRGMLDGFRLERDRALADLEAAQIAHAVADAAADAAALREADEARKARGHWARLRAAWWGQ
jgi:hypothetical protein